MSNRYGITLDSEWIEWAAKEKVSETGGGGAADLQNPPPSGGRGQTHSGGVREGSRYCPSVTGPLSIWNAAALKSRSPIARPQSESVATDRETAPKAFAVWEKKSVV